MNKTTGNQIALKGTVFICAACGRRSRDKYGFQKIDRGWDESCMLNSVLCFDKQVKNSKGEWQWQPVPESIEPMTEEEAELQGRIVDATGTEWSIHDRTVCGGRDCPFHGPSDHKMKDWPIVIRDSTLVERKCEHGVGHPDPDSLTYFKKQGRDFSVHGCDGCCTGAFDDRLILEVP